MKTVFYLAKSTFTLAISLLILGNIAGCAKEKYIAKPIDAKQTAAKLLNKDVTSNDFKNYLLQQGYKAAELPFASWGLIELTHCALFYHTYLAVVKAQLALANSQINAANTRQNPTFNSNVARSNQKNGDLKPWALGLNVEIPIETNNKSQLRVEQAQFLADAAALDVADIAWQLRTQIANDLLVYQQNLASSDALKTTLATQSKIMALLQRRVDLGAVSNTDLNLAKIKLLQTQSALHSEQAKLPEIHANLAADVGLSTEKFNQLSIQTISVDALITTQKQVLEAQDVNKNLQTDALLNRIDIRRSLAKYAAAESNIKLEVAKQTPDISLTPGFAFEFGDSIWSLGFSSLLNLLNKNPTLIAEAAQLRAVQGAQFEALQANIIAEISQRLTAYKASMQNLNQLNEQLNAQILQSQKMQRQFAAGLIDKLDITQNALNTQLITQLVLSEKFKLLQTALTIENSMQKPLFIN